jgi:hypothetical protein
MNICIAYRRMDIKIFVRCAVLNRDHIKNCVSYSIFLINYHINYMSYIMPLLHMHTHLTGLCGTKLMR